MNLSFRLMLGTLATLTALASSASAQWPSNAALNLAIADRANDQVQPKVRSTSDGGCYISWFDNATGGYDVYLQRLDARGYEQWAHNGLRIADRSYSSTTDYDLAVDAGDNAILTYNDDRSGSDQIGCNKISPSGTLLWGPTGVLLTNTTEFVASPRVAVNSEGDTIVGWTQDDAFCLQKVNASGVPQWLVPVRVVPTTGFYGLSDLREAGHGTVIALWIYYTGGYTSPKYLYTQKYTAAGAPVWGFAPVIVYDGGSVQNGYFPDFAPDGAGGAVYGWYEVSGVRNCYVQHVSAAGAELFPHNGVAASTLTTRIRMSPSVAYNPASGETFLFWTEANSLQTQWGLFGQRFSATGSRLWTNTGRQLLPLSAQQNGFIKTVISGSGATVFYIEDAGPARLMANRLDGLGNVVWPVAPRAVSAVLSSKWGLDVVQTPSGMALSAWADQRVDGGNIYAQNVNPDGSLGLPAFIFGDLNCDGVVGFRDINPFVLLLSDPSTWQTAYPGCSVLSGDINHDGTVNFRDINPFVALLSGS